MKLCQVSSCLGIGYMTVCWRMDGGVKWQNYLPLDAWDGTQLLEMRISVHGGPIAYRIHSESNDVNDLVHDWTIEPPNKTVTRVDGTAGLEAFYDVLDTKVLGLFTNDRDTNPHFVVSQLGFVTPKQLIAALGCMSLE